MGLWRLNATFVKALKSAWPTVSAVCVFTVISSKASTCGFFVCFAAAVVVVYRWEAWEDKVSVKNVSSLGLRGLHRSLQVASGVSPPPPPGSPPPIDNDCRGGQSFCFLSVASVTWSLILWLWAPLFTHSCLPFFSPWVYICLLHLWGSCPPRSLSKLDSVLITLLLCLPTASGPWLISTWSDHGTGGRGEILGITWPSGSQQPGVRVWYASVCVWGGEVRRQGKRREEWLIPWVGVYFYILL